MCWGAGGQGVPELRGSSAWGFRVPEGRRREGS